MIDRFPHSRALSFFTFDLSRMPAGLVEWKAAALDLTIGNYAHAMADGTGGALRLYSTGAALDAINISSPMTDLGVLAPDPNDTSNPPSAILSITSELMTDYARRNDLGSVLELVVRFENEPTKPGEEIFLRCSDVTLELEYLVP